MDKYNFQKLTPINDVELNIYDHALDFIFKNDDVKNIAISGAYSAGKSSVLETYKKKHSNIKFLHISLAHFKSPMEKEDEEAEIKESVLEGKILNQLIHQINSDKIPQTNFKIKRQLDNKKIIQNVVLIMITIVMILHLTMFNSWQAFVNSISINWFIWLKNILLLTAYSETRIFSGTILFILFGVIWGKIIKIQKNKNILKKISLQGNEIEIFEENEDSYFDKYLNEVLYLFENSDADVIVFEDMDRYNVNQIFQRLREVNTLVNNQLKKENKNPLRFFYLLRDDIFISKDRTKFFDYIMPVVPVIDSSNSYDQFIAHFKAGGIFELFKQNFLQDVSLYVDDMRILKNIYNEFVVYNNRINTTEQDYNKLLALIIYKNIFPRDFSDLQLNKGFIYTLFAKKEGFISDEKNNINKKIDTLNEKIDKAQKEILRSDEELSMVYSKKIEELGYYRHKEKEILNEEWDERKEAVKNKEVENIERIKQDIFNLQEELEMLKNKKLCNIISRNNIDNIFKTTYINEIGVERDFNEIKETPYFDLIKYLIRNGYIDESYADYMTYFYENSLSRIDKTFLRSVSDKKAKEYTYELKSPRMVIDRLSDVSFDEEEILNFDLFCFLLTTPEYDMQLHRFLLQLKNTKNFKFIQGFFISEREIQQLVFKLNNQWQNFFSEILSNGVFTESQVKLYSIYTLYYSQDIINMVNNEKSLTDYISDNSNYLDIENPNIDKLIKGFKLINICFKSINYDIANKDLFIAVYENRLYQITFGHITLMLKTFYGIEESEDFNHKNYTLILSLPESPLAQYINGNINYYIEIIINHCEGSIVDDESVVLSMLNNDEITLENKLEYIKVLKTPITLLEKVSDKDTWSLLLQNNLVVYSENNILEYFFNSEKNLDDILVEFVNSQDNHLDFSDSINDFGKDASSSFFKVAIVCNDLNNEKYREIMRSLRRYYDSFKTEGISNEKIDILIDLETIRMSQDSLLFIRDEYPTNTLHFIKKNIDSYVNDVISGETFDFNEMVDVLSLDTSDENKINLLKFTDEAISIIDTDYSNTVKIYILNNNLEENDIPKLLTAYLHENSPMKIEIENLTVRQKQVIFSESYPFSMQLFEKLLADTRLTYEDKVEFFIIILPTFDKRQAIIYLDKLNLKDYVRLFDLGRPKFVVNNVNERILEIFKDKNWITKYEVDKDDSGYYRAFGRRLQDELPNELL